MTAALSPQFGESFERADAVEIFFSEDEIRRIGKFEEREIPPKGEPTSSCNTNLFFGFFFDGTRNNYEKANPTKSHSNVARLYDCFPGESVPGVLPENTGWTHNPFDYKNFFRVYIPGVASPFAQVKDSGEGFFDATLGGGAGRQSNERIVWALVQAINNVHRFLLEKDLISSDEATEIATRLELSKEARHEMTSASQYGDERLDVIRAPRIAFEKLLRRLHARVSQHWKKPGCALPSKIDPGVVGTIHISVFGFSRGAAKARAFSNWLESLCRLDAMIRGQGGLSLRRPRTANGKPTFRISPKKNRVFPQLDRTPGGCDLRCLERYATQIHASGRARPIRQVFRSLRARLSSRIQKPDERFELWDDRIQPVEPEPAIFRW